MFTFNLKGKSGILIFTLYNNRLGEGRTYTSYGSERKRLNSYAFFNTDTKELKIVHYDYIKARVYDSSILAYTISPGERIIGLKGKSCYYIDHNGQEVGYAGDLLFFHKYHIEESKRESSNKQTEDNQFPNFDEFESPEKQGFKIDGNKIVYDHGEVYHSDYLLKDKFRNIITCYLVVDKKEYYETRLFGICDDYGKLLSEIKYDEIWASENQIIRDKYLRVKIDGKFGLISLDGKEILPVVYEFIDDCDGNIAIVKRSDSNYHIIALNTMWDNYPQIYISKINDGIYSFYFNINFSFNQRFVLENKKAFNITYTLSESQKSKAFERAPGSAVRVNFIYKAIKSYPTSSMYIEAAKEDARKAEQEYQKALEEAQKKAGWSGSGFALNQGHIVTNYHVIEEAKTILIKGVKGDFQTELRAKVVATDKINDIAILKIDDERFKGFGTIPYKVKREMSDVGETVWALGYPMTDVMGEEIKFTDGKISSRTGIQGDISVYQISVPIQPGNSGGALFDNNGNIVGITSSGLNREAFNSENVNYAIKTSYLYNLIESTLATSILPQGTAMQGQPLTQKIKLAKNFVFLILCSTSSDFHANKLPITKSVTPATTQQGQAQTSKSQTPIKSNRDTLANGDIVILNPKYSSNSYAQITKVTISKHNTIIDFKWFNTQYIGGWCNINENAYLLDNSGRKYRLVQAENISYSPDRDEVPLNSVKTFTLYFGKVPTDTKKFDFIEDAGTSGWKIYGIEIN